MREAAGVEQGNARRRDGTKQGLSEADMRWRKGAMKRSKGGASERGRKGGRETSRKVP